MKRRFKILALGAALLLALAATNVQAQQVRFGPQLELFDFEELGVGARVDFGLGQAFGITDGVFRNLFGSASATYLFTSGPTTLTFNANLAVPLQAQGQVTPYLGAGLNHVRTSGAGSRSGLNLLGGLFFDVGTLPAFTELRFSTTGSSFISLTGGVLFQ